MATKYMEHLEKLRAHLRGERRKLAEKMATGPNMPKSFTKLMDLQSEFDAIGRAIEDESHRGRDAGGTRRHGEGGRESRTRYAAIENDED